MTCEVDTIFRAAVIPLEVSGADMYTTKPLDTKSITLLPPMTYTGLDFGEFKGDSRPASRSHEMTNDSNHYETMQPDRKISTSPISMEPNEGTLTQPPLCLSL